MTTVLVTGATGFLGREIVCGLLSHDRATRLVALIRAPDGAELERRRASIVADLTKLGTSRLTAVRGDMTAPHLGLDPRSWKAMVEQVDRVVHVAATTRFDHPLDEARRQNVGSTREVLQLCRRVQAAGRSGRLDYVSTAYVAGDRRDVVGEDEFAAGQSFRNTYEETKRVCKTVYDRG